MTIIEDVLSYILYVLKAFYLIKIAKIDLSTHTNEKIKSNPGPVVNWRSKFNR